MVITELEKAPPFAALSYTWGNKEKSRVVRVDGHEVHITTNLAEAVDAIWRFAKERDLLF